MTFNDWYETYERDGGELMLFNTLDLEAAWQASRAAAFAECERIADDLRGTHGCTVAEEIADAIRAAKGREQR